MIELSKYEIELVSGGGGSKGSKSKSMPAPKTTGNGTSRPHDVVPSAQSDWGNFINDMSNALGQIGENIGISIYDMAH